MLRITPRRLPTNPIVSPASHSSIGANINGPSLIRVPPWLPHPLGAYYLYFAHHQGQFIRLAYADALAGPWTVHAPGTLQLDQTPCHGHIASPDVHIDHTNQRIVMYYHGPYLPQEAAVDDPTTRQFPIVGGQRTFVAFSTDGIHFTSNSEPLGTSYFRVFAWREHVYALGMPGIMYRSRDGLTNFVPGPTLFDADIRHAAVRCQDDTLTIFYSRAGDCPEHILYATIALSDDWLSWRASAPVSVLRPAEPYEGAHVPVASSQRGAVHEPVHQLRDPCIFTEDNRTYLLYSVAGERGIAIAELEMDADDSNGG